MGFQLVNGLADGGLSQIELLGRHAHFACLGYCNKYFQMTDGHICLLFPFYKIPPHRDFYYMKNEFCMAGEIAVERFTCIHKK